MARLVDAAVDRAIETEKNLEFTLSVGWHPKRRMIKYVAASAPPIVPSRRSVAWVPAGEGWALNPGRAFVLLPLREGETESSPPGLIAPLRKALLEDNRTTGAT
jgi:hypothetical protein